MGSRSTGVLLGGAELGRCSRARGARGTGGRRCCGVGRGLGAGGGGGLLSGAADAVRGTGMGLAVRDGSLRGGSIVSAEASDPSGPSGPSLRRVSSLSLGIFWCSRTHQGVPAALAAAAATAAAATFDAQPCGLPMEKHVLLFDQTGASDLCVFALFASCGRDSASVSGSASGSLGSSQCWRFSAIFSFASARGVPASAGVAVAVVAVAGPRPLLPLEALAPALLARGLGGRGATAGGGGSVGPVGPVGPGSGRIAEAWLSVRTGGALLGLHLTGASLSGVAVSFSFFSAPGAGELERGVCEVLRLAGAGVGVAPLAGVGTLGHRPMGLPRTSKRWPL